MFSCVTLDWGLVFRGVRKSRSFLKLSFSFEKDCPIMNHYGCDAQKSGDENICSYAGSK